MIFSSGLSVPEGPVLLEDGSWLVVEMGGDRGSVTHLSPDGFTKSIIARTGRPNGLAVESDGTIWVAESKDPALLRITPSGEVEEFLKACAGVPFLFPNDLAFGPDGALYMTDSGILADDFAPGGKVRSDWMDVTPNGRVYRINVKTRAIETLDEGIRFTNGIAFDAGGNLYISETLTGMIYRYRRTSGSFGQRELFGNVISPDAPEGFKGPDGMKFGLDGNLYVTVFGQGDITVLDQQGEVVRRIRTQGSMPTNIVFGRAGSRKIYVTEDEDGTLEVFDVGTDGLPLHTGGTY